MRAHCTYKGIISVEAHIMEQGNVRQFELQIKRFGEREADVTLSTSSECECEPVQNRTSLI